jgi:hypothetical protein
MEIFSLFFITMLTLISVNATSNCRIDFKDIAGNNLALGCPVMDSEKQ